MFVWMLLLSVTPGDDWKMIAYDRQRTARTPAVGRIEKPHQAWQLDTAVHDTYVVASSQTGSDALSLTNDGGLPGLSHTERLQWGLAAPRLDVVGDGQLVEPPGAPGARWGKLLPDVPGLQRLSWTTTWGEDAHFQMHSFESGLDAPRLVWDVPFGGAMYSPLVVVTDLDGDGRLEAVLSMWHGVVAYDITTGEEIARCMYREGHGRQYGFFGAYTDPDGHAYLVVIGDFAGHIGVLAWRNGQIEALWSHLFDPQSEQGIDRRFTINTIGPDPIGDFDGDGRGEVLMNVFNEAGDGRWHLLAYDLDTGEHRLDLTGIYLHGHTDMDGDGVSELLTQHCASRPVATNGDISIHRWDEPVWKHPHARWSMQSLPELPLTHISGATKGMNAPVAMPLGEQSTMFFTSHSDRETLHALRLGKDNHASSAWRVGAPAGTTLDAIASSDGAVLIRCRTEHDAVDILEAQGTRLSAIAQERVVRDVPQPLVLSDVEHGSQIVLADAMDHIGGWRLGNEQKPERLWHVPGRAMTTQVPQMLGLAAADIDRDGADEILCVRELSDGSSRLIALDLDGRERWHHDFPEFGGRAPVWNEGGTTIWQVGRFVDPQAVGVLVSNRRSIMHSDETVMIDPLTSRVVWHKDVLEVRNPWTDTPWPHTRGYGGGPFALADFDGDGLDEIVHCYPAEYSVVSGKTGEQIIVENTGPLKGTDNFWVFSGNPLIADLNGDGRFETLWTSPAMILVFSHIEGHAQVVWHTEPNDGTSALPAIGDTDADGKLEIGLPGCGDGFRCVDATTGRSLWSVSASGNGASNCVAIDIDGDGVEEFLYADGNQVRAVGGRSEREKVLWQIELPADIGYVAVATINGELWILACGRDGVVYGICDGSSD